MTLQALETLPNSVARLSKPSLCLMTFWLKLCMGLPFLIGFDKWFAPLSKPVTPPFARRLCQIKSKLLHPAEAGILPYEKNLLYKHYAAASLRFCCFLRRATKPNNPRPTSIKA